MTKHLPEEYYILEVKEDQIIIGMGFKHFNQECAPEVIYGGERYKWGPMTIIPKSLASSICSAREYNKV